MSENSNALLIERFYAAFDRRDGTAMEACYAPDVRFSDPVFPDLRGPRAGAMWQMLTEGSKDLRVELLDHEADEDSGSARWRARYTFAATGRGVVNEVRASFRFTDGLIVEHRDEFDFHAWARQALGTSGLLFGWTPMMRSAVRRKAADRLEKHTGVSGERRS